MEFKIGDLIVYGETGVCRVEDIVERPFLGEVTSCYKLSPLYQSCVIFTPANNGNVFMREIISRQEAEKLIDSIKSVEPKDIPTASPRALSESYDKIIKLHDCRELVNLTVSIHAKRQKLIEQKKKLSAIDERYIKKAEDLLFGELAAALEIDKGEVRSFIEEKVGIG